LLLTSTIDFSFNFVVKSISHTHIHTLKHK